MFFDKEKDAGLVEYFHICEVFHKFNIKGKNCKPVQMRHEGKRFSVPAEVWQVIPHHVKGEIGIPYIYIISNDPEDYEGWIPVNIK